MKILYDDKWICVCVKPAGVLSESGGMPELLSDKLGGDFYCVHRLDRAVGGVMVYARSPRSAAALTAQMADGRFKKEYLAVIPGSPADSRGTLRDLLFKDSAKNKSFVVKSMRKGVREAVLDYEVTEAREGLSLVHIALDTGRSHQIRVQFSSRGFPLLGDIKYGSRERDCGIALWACALSFRHPVSGGELHFSARPEPLFPWDKFSMR